MIMILLTSVGSFPNMLILFVFIRMNKWLQLDHFSPDLALGTFLGFQEGFVRVEIWGIQVEFICPLLSSLNALIFLPREEKGITFLLHIVKMVDSVV